jgi:hypothetical protein
MQARGLVPTNRLRARDDFVSVPPWLSSQCFIMSAAPWNQLEGGLVPATTVWERLTPSDASSDAGAELEPSPEESQDSQSTSSMTPKKFWRRVRLLDVIACLTWAYVVTKLLVDWDRAAVRAIAPDFEWLVNFRVLIAGAVVLGLAYMGKKLFPLWLAYIVLWPLLLLTWRIPWRLYKQGKWNHMVGLVHVMAGAISGLKSALRGLLLAVSSLLFLLLPWAWTAWVSLGLAALFELWLLIAAVRSGIRPSRFLVWQRRMVSSVKSTVLVQENQISGLRPVIHGSRQLTRTETDQFLQVASSALLVNRVTYFWAYRVNEYRKSPALIAYSALAIVWLLMGSLGSFSVMNLALYEMDPRNFELEGPPSVARFVYYSLTSLYSGETQLIMASSDLALVVKILATVTGVVMVMALLVTLFMSFRYTRDEAEARRTVDEMREAAVRLESEFADEFQLTPEDALERFQEFNHGLTGLLVYLTRAVPHDFMRS